MKRTGQQFTQRVTVQVQKKLLKKQLSRELWQSVLEERKKMTMVQ
ncbi:hypothetical protein EUBVEN_01942 [Eubacterium ventriosum ATCC 27560]|uniref:Uncharacterized protein n=1 Tax=Eubacterium ventriosum ATCC 27560 TaxID=411463 RepID=A5Z8A1_9FIRM|nr:hypothetical protein EUBVEN_01942 [Eubacterium ventriosum ATCC 27560]